MQSRQSIAEGTEMNDRDVIDQHANAVHRRDAAHVFRLVVVAAIVVALIAVAMDNRDDVRLGYAVGDAQAPVWIVVVAAAVGGMIIGWLMRHRSRHSD
jgi:uncharacterized integral membrane protein